MVFGFMTMFACFSYQPRSIAQGLPAVLIVWASIGACSGWLKFRPIALLGAASYAIYLFHWASFGAAKPIADGLNPYLLATMLVAVGLTSF
jgi:peptidoglycan/LPS O-acetylase OafA/YrhL